MAGRPDDADGSVRPMSTVRRIHAVSAGGEDTARPRCAVCGEIVGVYEPLLWRRPDASVVACGWLEARADARHAHPDSAFFHATCLRDDPDAAGAA